VITRSETTLPTTFPRSRLGMMKRLRKIQSVTIILHSYPKLPMRNSHSLLILFSILSLFYQLVSAEPVDRNQLLDEASRFFQQATQLEDQTQSAELYNKALIRFEKLVQDGVVNGKLYYNLGNTYFQLHDLGRAIVNYRRALAYLPEDDNLRQNLRYAESQQPDRIEPKQEAMIAKTLLFWHYDLSARFRLILLAFANAAFWCVLAMKLYRRQGLWWPLAVTMAFSLMMGGSLLYERLGHHPGGVLISPETMARKGDGQAYSPSFNEPLHAGLLFSLVEKRGEWLYIELVDGRRCWVPADSAEMI
jgi:tetratricopeptide (TPR) repeat protein